MEVPGMICLLALCSGPLKSNVIGFWVGGGVGVRGNVSDTFFGAALHPLGVWGKMMGPMNT